MALRRTNERGIDGGDHDRLQSAIDFQEFNRQLWEQLAEPWERRRERHEPQLEPITNWLLDGLRPQQGETVLEVAAENGETGLRTAAFLGDRAD